MFDSNNYNFHEKLSKINFNVNLKKTYYNCIYKLFKINILSYDTLIINSHLKKLNLMSFQHRVFQKLVFLAFNVKYGSYSPKELKDCFHCNKQTLPYNLRESSKEYISLSRSNTNYCDLTFKFLMLNCSISILVF